MWNLIDYSYRVLELDILGIIPYKWGRYQMWWGEWFVSILGVDWCLCSCCCCCCCSYSLILLTMMMMILDGNHSIPCRMYLWSNRKNLSHRRCTYGVDGAFVKLSTGISQSKWSDSLMFVTGFRIWVSSSDSILLSRRRSNLSIPNCSTSNQLFSPSPQNNMMKTNFLEQFH